jgi:hypothetical protein
MVDAGKPHDHLEIHTLAEGGYVIRSGRFDGCTDGNYRQDWIPRWELVAFSTLAEATMWIAKNMVDRPAVSK